MKKHEDGFSITLVLITVAVIGLMTTAGIIVLNRQQNNENEQANYSQTIKPDEYTNVAIRQPEDITAKIKSTYESRYTLLDLDENNQPKQGEMSIRLMSESPPYKAEGFNFYTDYDGGSTIELMAGPANAETMPRVTETTIRTEIADIYKEFGLTKTTTYMNQDDGSNRDVYVGNGLICIIDSPDAPISLTSASCGSIAAYGQAATTAQPIASKLPDMLESTILANIKITNSAVSGYQKAQLNRGDITGGGGSVELFYKKDGNSWAYFTGSQETLPCTMFNTTDLRAAFKGETCYGTDDKYSIVE